MRLYTLVAIACLPTIGMAQTQTARYQEIVSPSDQDGLDDLAAAVRQGNQKVDRLAAAIEKLKPQPGFVLIGQGGIAINHPRLLQRTDPPQTRGLGKVDGVSQLHVADTAVLLQLFKNQFVVSIHIHSKELIIAENVENWECDDRKCHIQSKLSLISQANAARTPVLLQETQTISGLEAFDENWCS